VFFITGGNWNSEKIQPVSGSQYCSSSQNGKQNNENWDKTARFRSHSILLYYIFLNTLRFGDACFPASREMSFVLYDVTLVG
jgi:hypothetical protein